MKIRLQKVGGEVGPIHVVAQIPGRGDVVSAPGGDRTVKVVDYQVGKDREFDATVWYD